MSTYALLSRVKATIKEILCYSMPYFSMLINLDFSSADHRDHDSLTVHV